ncbi:hypothetical protein ACS5NO_32185 [Larkinella sp. GY13]|uniref:hypothetical protein n=1 Tax=Larkinella sp. GY13 TaxID=3453720 RepID=UPI003EEC434D
MIRLVKRWLFMRKVRRTDLAKKHEYELSKAVHNWVQYTLRRSGVPILHFHMKNEGKRDAPQTWVEKALGIVQAGWTDSTFLISAPGKPQLIIMVELKVGKASIAADHLLSDNQVIFRDTIAKPMAIPHYAVAARTPFELIPMLAKILCWHMDRAGYDTRNV